MLNKRICKICNKSFTCNPAPNVCTLNKAVIDTCRCIICYNDYCKKLFIDKDLRLLRTCLDECKISVDDTDVSFIVSEML